jgi:hypothetical protein
MDTGAVADTLMSALTRVQTALAPPPDTAGDAEYAALCEVVAVGRSRSTLRVQCFRQNDSACPTPPAPPPYHAT